MSILNFDKPVKLKSTEKWNSEHSSDSNINGTYVPNMSDTDKLKWKAKRITGKDERVEIRKTVSGTTTSAQTLLVVRASGVDMSANSRMEFSNKTWLELFEAVKEAQTLLS